MSGDCQVAKSASAKFGAVGRPEFSGPVSQQGLVLRGVSDWTRQLVRVQSSALAQDFFSVHPGLNGEL